MKLTEIILFSLAVAFFIIGVHQAFTVGLLESYWIFMFTAGLLLLYKIKKNNSKPEETAQQDAKQPLGRQKKPVKKATTRR